jgi:hypothetical protein
MLLQVSEGQLAELDTRALRRMRDAIVQELVETPPPWAAGDRATDIATFVDSTIEFATAAGLGDARAIGRLVRLCASWALVVPWPEPLSAALDRPELLDAARVDRFALAWHLRRARIVPEVPLDEVMLLPAWLRALRRIDS